MNINQNENMSNNIMLQRSVYWIIVNKVLDLISNAPLIQIIQGAMLFLLSLIIAFIMIYPNITINAIKYIYIYNNYTLPKISASFLIVYNFKYIYNYVKNIIPEKIDDEESDTIEGIPVFELLDHLFEYKSFKRDDIEKKFAVPRNRFTELAQRFEEMNILVRWSNNSRILNEDFSRQDIARIINWKTKASEIEMTFRPEGESKFTILPIWKVIKEKINNMFEKNDESAAAPSFKVRKIWQLMAS